MKKHYKKNESDDFVCKNCKQLVSGTSFGTKQRNHCPYCLYSFHIDEKIGDRESSCRGLMKPIGLTTKKDGEIMIIHECQKCGKISNNRIAGDDNTDTILELAKISPTIDIEEVKIQLFGKRPN
jgi:DNA-directed RNA polymerase subunit RPC12/RpoP